MAQKPKIKLKHKRAPTGARRSFQSAQSDRLTGSWATDPLTADQIIQRHQRTLVARAREQCSNNDYAKHFLGMVGQNIVGHTGVKLQAQARDPSGDLDRVANEAIETAWQEWSRAENCDVVGQQTLRSFEDSAVRTGARDGEFVFLIRSGPNAGPWGFALQEVDPQRCSPLYHNTIMRDGGYIRSGIEYDASDRPVAYHFEQRGTKDDNLGYGLGYGPRDRIPVAGVVHGFRRELVGQRRGLPWLATSLWRMNMLGGFENAALVNARAGASKGGFLSWKEGYEPDDSDEEVELEDEQMLVEAGTYQMLPPGLEPHKHDPLYPNGEFGPFHKSMLRGIAAGLGVAYNSFANDLESVNFSSIRQGALTERDFWRECQVWLVESFHDRIFREWLRHALINRKILVPARGGEMVPLRADRFEKYARVTWQPRRWDWVDPQKDVNAAVTAIRSLLTSPSQVIRDRGRDPQAVFSEIANDIAAMREAGIPEGLIGQAMSIAAATPAAEPPPQSEGDES